MILGAAAGAVILRCLDNQPIHHPVVRAFVGEIAWIVELSELVDGQSNEARLLCVITGRLVDDDDVEVGLVAPAAQGAGAEEDGAIHGGLGH